MKSSYQMAIRCCEVVHSISPSCSLCFLCAPEGCALLAFESVQHTLYNWRRLMAMLQRSCFRSSDAQQGREACWVPDISCQDVHACSLCSMCALEHRALSACQHCPPRLQNLRKTDAQVAELRSRSDCCGAVSSSALPDTDHRLRPAAASGR